jgi:hypothetical protein
MLRLLSLAEEIEINILKEIILQICVSVICNEQAILIEIQNSKNALQTRVLVYQ